METVIQEVVEFSAASVPTLFVNVYGDRIAYREFGTGTPILLANRMRGTLDTWDPLFLDQLSTSNRLVLFDYPGIGYSEGKLPTDFKELAQFVRDFTSAIGLSRFAMLGWSWGGFVTQATLLDFPDMVTHAILVGTNPPGKNEVLINQFWVDRALKAINDLEDEEILFFEPASEESRLAARMSRERIYSRPDVVTHIPSTMDIFMEYFKGAEGFKADSASRRKQLTESKTPMLIICGDNDTSVHVKNWYPLIGEIPGAQLIVFPQSGHGPQHQYPELSAEYINSFVRIQK
ncbi:alpha/beta fold hydrolase [Flavihumibacter solisilvae]|uniref:Alpha/beta hydrolase n=1 Tax=Flavihumibacter solisilvae TaxID=1349421 RepID=A0A0C1L3F8_9BACT|nr:alpha/beta hydrolase [Flavihumibacter solisilvae]KIC94497.1 alpha/beta hydrolase [Flavihumibacter solisilvae]